MEQKTIREKLEGRELRLFCIFSIMLLFAAGFVGIGKDGESLWDALKGIWIIFVSRDALITDYFELAGYGAAFLNAALVVAIGFVLLRLEKVKLTGLTLAVFFINAGYALWGKNPLNILPILLGTFLYARLQGADFGRYIYTALFGTSLAPLVTELVFILPFNGAINLLIAVLGGIGIGFWLPILSAHTSSMHKGYNLFNVGFSAGILAFVMVSVLKVFSIESESVMLWREERPLWIGAGLYAYFLLTFVYGCFLNQWKVKGIAKVLRYAGKAATDFVLMESAGSTLMNMGIIGAVCTTYIYLIGGDFSGPVVGAVLTAFGFAAYGVHIKNYLPLLGGVFLSTFMSQFEPTEPVMQLAAIFAVGLAPIAGRFGLVPGLIAGMLHAAIVTCTTQMYGGLNLYNNGFSAGWVAIILVPGLENLLPIIKKKNQKRKSLFKKKI